MALLPAPYSRWPAAAAAPAARRQDPVEQVPESGGLRDKVARRAERQGATSRRPTGKTLQQIAEQVKGAGPAEVGLASSIFTVGQTGSRSA